MKTVVLGQVHSGVGIVEKQRKSLVRSIFAWFAWVYDRFVFYVVYRGRRLRPEVKDRLERAIQETEQGKNMSPKFADVEDAIRWLDS